MTTVVRAYRDRPLTRPGQLDRLAERFGLEQEEPWLTVIGDDVTRGPDQSNVSTIMLMENEGGDLELAVCLEGDDAAKAPELIRELRMCGFVASVDAECSDAP